MGDLSRTARGRWGEDLAVRHLSRLGYRIVDRNWRSPESHLPGELDVIASIDGGVVICEVKARRRGSVASAATAVGERKQAQIRSLAESWLRVTHVDPDFVRFDVIAIDGVRLTHIDGAF